MKHPPLHLWQNQFARGPGTSHTPRVGKINFQTAAVLGKPTPVDVHDAQAPEREGQLYGGAFDLDDTVREAYIPFPAAHFRVYDRGAYIAIERHAHAGLYFVKAVSQVRYQDNRLYRFLREMAEAGQCLENSGPINNAAAQVCRFHEQRRRRAFPALLAAGKALS